MFYDIMGLMKKLFGDYSSRELKSIYPIVDKIESLADEYKALSDAQLQAKYGVVGAEALIDAMLKPGQFIDLLLAVQEINGFSSDMDELRDEAKN